MEVKDAYQAVLKEVKKKIAGKNEVIELMFVGLIADGNVLLEGVPGVAKTTMAKTLADVVQASFGRVQGTPDLEYSDIVGHTYIDESHEVKLKKGPIFNNIFLIDELNRMPAKTTTALLESLEERQVSIADHDVALPKPFMAVATQNPLSIEGTNPLPKVLADRFLMRIGVDYPSMEEEQEMLRIKESEEQVKLNKILTTDQIIKAQEKVKLVKMPDEVINYITRIVGASRSDIHVVMGGSPRAEISFMRCGKARALINGRDTVEKEDIKMLTRAVLSHRIAVRSTGGIGVNGIIDGITASVR